MKTDSELQTDVQDELKWWPGVNESQIGVTAKDGIIALTGRVEHYAEKIAAEDAAKCVYGVKGLANEIEVELPALHERDDQDIVKAALNALKWDYSVPSDKLTVIVKNGWLTLEGTVDWQYQKDAANRCVQNLMGVAMVSNHIKLKPVTKWIDVKSKIEDAFRRNSDIEARRITVTSKNGAVTLKGSVASWAEKNTAVWAAWSAPGVISVADELAVVP